MFEAAWNALWLFVIPDSLWSQPVSLSTTPQAFLFLLPWSLLWRYVLNGRQDLIVSMVAKDHFIQIS